MDFWNTWSPVYAVAAAPSPFSEHALGVANSKGKGQIEKTRKVGSALQTAISDADQWIILASRALMTNLGLPHRSSSSATEGFRPAAQRRRSSKTNGGSPLR